MALRKTHDNTEPQAITPMDEIRRRKGMPFDDSAPTTPGGNGPNRGWRDG